MYNRRQSMCVTLILNTLQYCFHETEAQVDLTAAFLTGGIHTAVWLYQKNSNVRVQFGIDLPDARWQIHELPVDFSIDPKLRCRPEYVGQYLQYSGSTVAKMPGECIKNVNTTSLVLHSMIILSLVNDTPVTCGTIIPNYLAEFSATHVMFKSGVFGKMYNFYWPLHTGLSYVVGSIQTEWRHLCGNKDMTSNIRIAIHNDTQLGPYDTVAMRNGCAALEGGTTILTLDIGVNCSSFATFSRHLSEPLKLSSCLGCAISVQKPSGAILGCGRVEGLFPVNAMYNKRITLSQHTPYLPTRLVDLLNLKLDILQYNVLEGVAGTFCNKSAIFDPWSPPPMQIGSTTTFDQFPVGDLSNRQPEWLFNQQVLLEVPLIGSATVLGHMVNDSYCGLLQLSVLGADCISEALGNGYIVKGYAEFDGPYLKGRIRLTQVVYLPERVMGPTIITVDLAFKDLTQNTSGHAWSIHEGFTDSNGTCTDHIGAQYNPYGVNTTKASGYLDDCTSRSQQRCAMGNLSGKLGPLGLEPLTTIPHKTYSFYDENLFLTGPFNIFGRAVVVNGTGDQSNQILGCANIEPELVANASDTIEISFPRNGTEPKDINRAEMGHYLACFAGVPLGDVLVKDVQAVNISGNDCLTASLWITGENERNATQNAEEVKRALNQQNLTKYNSGSCVTVSPKPPTESQTSDSIIIIISASMVVLILLVVIIGAFMIVTSRRKQRTLIYTVEGQEGTREFSLVLVRLLPSKGDKWELLGSHFKIGIKLGEGNYGQVYKGTLSMEVTMAPAKGYIARQTRNGKPPYTVAIKLLKGGAEEREVENFLEEIAMMKKVSSGECCHVVQMVCCVSTALPLALAMEFVPFGDLLSYLKYWRKNCTVLSKKSLSQPCPLQSSSCGREDAMVVFHSDAVKNQEGKDGRAEVLCLAAALDQEAMESAEDFHLAANRDQELYSISRESTVDCFCDDEGSESQLLVPLLSSCDKMYPKESEEEVLYSAPTKDLESFYSPLGEPNLKDLPSFAYQISQGMEYLSSLGILHRDLACRNILVDERKLLKISDFGLSRDTSEYMSSLKDKMPLRWMAPETVTENVFTDKSDMWSFGVCLWEMYTLGDIPYEDLPMASLMARIISGYRLHRPEHSSENVYQLMLSCWSSEPQARLNFTQLKYSFKSIIAAGNKDTNYITIQS